MEMDHHIFHLGVVDRALGGAAPRVLGRRIAVVQADQVDMVEIDEFQAGGILDPAAEDEVKLAHGRAASIKDSADSIGRVIQSDGPRTALTAALPLVRAASPIPSIKDWTALFPASRVILSSASFSRPASLAASAAVRAVSVMRPPTLPNTLSS